MEFNAFEKAPQTYAQVPEASKSPKACTFVSLGIRFLVTIVGVTRLYAVRNIARGGLRLGVF